MFYTNSQAQEERTWHHTTQAPRPKQWLGSRHLSQSRTRKPNIEPRIEPFEEPASVGKRVVKDDRAAMLSNPPRRDHDQQRSSLALSAG